MLVAIDKRGSINLPSTIRKEMGLDRGAHLDLTVLEGGSIVLTPVVIYPALKLNEKGLKKLALPQTYVVCLIAICMHKKVNPGAQLHYLCSPS